MPVHRLQFDVSDETLREIDKLQQTTGLPSRAELIRTALKFLHWTLEQKREHRGTLLIESKDGKLREVVFPFWGSGAKAAD